MTMGVFVDGKRPTSKKQVREAIKDNPARVVLEATSWFGNEDSGNLAEITNGNYYFCGPDPYTSRKFYGQIIKAGGKIIFS